MSERAAIWTREEIIAGTDGSEARARSDAEPVPPRGVELPPLARVARSLSAALGVREVMQRISESSVELTRAFGAYVEQIISPNGLVEVVARAGRGTPPLGTRVPYPGSLTEEIIEGGIPSLISEIGSIGEAVAPYLAEECEGCSCLVVPLISEGDVLGTLVLLARTREHFGQPEVTQARILGDLASVSLRRVVLLQETERHRQELQESEGRFRALAENAVEAIATIDCDDRILFVNPAAGRIFGYAVEEMLRMRFSQLMPERFREQHLHGIRRYVETGRKHIPWDGIELMGLTREGREIPLEVTFSEYSREGEHYFTGIMRDISERKRGEEERARLLAAEREARAEAERRAVEESALRRAAEAVTASYTVEEASRRIVESALEAMRSDGAFVERIDRDESWVEVIAAAGQHVPAAGIRISYPGSFTERVVRRGEGEIIQRVSAAERPLPGDLLRICAECSALVVPLVSEGRARGSLVLLREPEHGGFQPAEISRAQTFGNLTMLALHKVRLLQDAERRRMEVEQITESRARLIRGFSHDLKNPLGAADGYAQLLEDGILGELGTRQLESIGRIRRSLHAALALINDLVDLARAESGQLAIEASEVDLRPLVLELAEEYRAQVEAEGLALRVALPDAFPQVRVDARRVRQILGNLISNAIKYNRPEGSVLIRAALRERAPSAPGRWVALDVSDTGHGIPEDKRDLLFREFTRLDPTAKHGAGLGLAISQRIALALGGVITFQSTVGEGTTFTLWLAPEEGRD